MSRKRYDVRREVLGLLLEKIAADPHPSGTMMDMVEQMLEPDEVPAYTEILLAKVRGDRFPSYGMLNRIANLAC